MGSNSVGHGPSLAIHLQLISIWDRLLKNQANGIDQNFFDLGGTSELARVMLREVQQATGRKMALADFLEQPTIRHLADGLIAQAQTEDMFLKVQDGPGVPFYFFHGDILGGGFYSQRLAKLLGHGQPFHVSPPIALSEHELPSVEELAARKRESLQKQQPHGPYVLGGFCVGAVVAYEVARQLEERGEDVRSVVLIEPEVGNAVTRSHQRVINSIAARRKKPREKIHAFMRGLQKIERLRHVWHAPMREKKDFILKNGRKVLRRGTGHAPSDSPAAEPEPVSNAADGIDTNDRDWLIPAYHWVLTSYVPKPYHGRVTLLLTDEHLDQAPFVLKQWQKVAPQVRVERIPGQHLSCITTHLGAIAEKIRLETASVRALLSMLLPAAGTQMWVLDLL